MQLASLIRKEVDFLFINSFGWNSVFPWLTSIIQLKMLFLSSFFSDQTSINCIAINQICMQSIPAFPIWTYMMQCCCFIWCVCRHCHAKTLLQTLLHCSTILATCFWWWLGDVARSYTTISLNKLIYSSYEQCSDYDICLT